MKYVEGDYRIKGIFITSGGSFLFNNEITDIWKTITPSFYDVGYECHNVFVYDLFFYRIGHDATFQI